MKLRIPLIALHVVRTVVAFCVFVLAFNMIARDVGTKLFSSSDIFDRLTLFSVIVGLCLSPFIFLDPRESVGEPPLTSKGPAYVTFIGGVLLAAWQWNVTNHPASAILISGLLATLGWLLTQRNARKAGKKQHTMNILMQIRQNEMLEYHTANIAQRYPYGQVVPRKDVEDLLTERKKWTYFVHVRDGGPLAFRQPHFPVLESIIWLGNYYEFICVGVLSGDLDLEMIKRSQRSQMCRFYRKAIHVLNHFQAVDALGQPSTTSFLSLRTIFERWSTEEERRVTVESTAAQTLAQP